VLLLLILILYAVGFKDNYYINIKFNLVLLFLFIHSKEQQEYEVMNFKLFLSLFRRKISFAPHPCAQLKYALDTKRKQLNHARIILLGNEKKPV
jgi:hypothetical protein